MKRYLLFGGANYICDPVNSFLGDFDEPGDAVVVARKAATLDGSDDRWDDFGFWRILDRETGRFSSNPGFFRLPTT